MMKGVLLQLAVGEEALKEYELTQSINREWTRKHRFAFHTVYKSSAPLQGRNIDWVKVYEISKRLDEGWPFVLYMDLDCLVIDPRHSPELCLGRYSSLGMVAIPGISADDNKHDFHYCSSLIAVRNTPESVWFFRESWEKSQKDEWDARWGERVLNRTIFEGRVSGFQVIENRWNSGPRNHVSDDEVIIRGYHGLQDRRSRIELDIQTHWGKYYGGSCSRPSSTSDVI